MSEQRSEQWFQDRLGRVTGSRFHDIMATGKDGKPLLSRKTAITEITLELLTGTPSPSWTSKATNWGIEHEPAARMAYEAHTGELCEEVGFIVHPRYQQAGASPDGLVGDRGGFEAKCPFNASVHLDTLLNGMPKEHIAQVQGGMWCTDRDWWHFVSYHPAFPKEMQLYIQCVPRDNDYIQTLEIGILQAIAEINHNVKTLLAKYGVKQ